MQPQITADGRSSSTKRKGRRVLQPISDDVLMGMYSQLKVSDADVAMATAALRLGQRQRVREFLTSDSRRTSRDPLSPLVLSAFLVSSFLFFCSLILLSIPFFFNLSYSLSPSPLFSFVFPYIIYIPLLSFFLQSPSFFSPSSRFPILLPTPSFFPFRYLFPHEHKFVSVLIKFRHDVHTQRGVAFVYAQLPISVYTSSCKQT